MDIYLPDPHRYEKMHYQRVGRSGLKLPRVSLGLWHNFGSINPLENSRTILHHAFDLGITHFDLANNYGVPGGSAEENFGRILARDFRSLRDEMVISTKAGWDMWPGPYGDFGSRKYLIASLDQSLKRMGLEYVDIFYHHRPDPETPLEETMGALDHLVRSGKALYVGVSAYSAEDTKRAVEILRNLGTPLLIHQPVYNMLDRWIEKDLITVLQDEGIGCIVFSPLAQGLLTERYLNGIPADSRAAGPVGFLTAADIQPDRIHQVSLLTEIAHKRGQSMAQMALAWNLRLPGVTSVLVGASSVKQIEENVNTLKNLEFTNNELQRIDQIIGKPQG